MVAAGLFDVDGTLVDSVDLHAEAWREAFLRFGHDLPYESVRSQIGKGGDQLMPVFLSSEEIEDYGEELEAWRAERFRREYLPLVRPLPRVRQLFQRLRRLGARIALASSSNKDDLAVYVGVLGVRDLLDLATSADDVGHSKPCPDVFLACLRRLGVPARRAMAVGDSPYDALAAGRAGVPTVGLLCGGFDPDDLRAAGCVALYRDPSDLLERLDGSPLALDEAPAQPGA
ncbi:HAD family hydrolase [Anaeromyxobacter paludicola]|uniref:Phosphoglycolate phosphatase n=1 Tax=Anaeromyxobacter paludicola TaxID=2918171 RepID=A0ABM7XFC3_9BACT|nr:HAD family hydrolase [Anaeromyxobacter paludicola]BDG10566.1 phosphoglycolate phosphatase [Anaeromyxobacter paludicola]